MVARKINITRTPEAWLALECFPGELPRVLDTFASEVKAREQGEELWFFDEEEPSDLRIVKDSPDLDLELPHWIPRTPASLTTREIWFRRHAEILDPFLKAPAQAHVMIYEDGALDDPRGTFRSSPTGPAPLPSGTSWPGCKKCKVEMAFYGTLDFREQPPDLEAPQGTLIAFYCEKCYDAHEVVWLSPDDKFEMTGSGTETRVGTRWATTEYPEPTGRRTKALEDLLERDHAYLLFACSWSTKVGGHFAPIQPHSSGLPNRRKKEHFIGQIIGNDDDLAYFIFNPKRQTTRMLTQSL